LIGLLAELRVTRPKLGVICTCGYAGVPIQLAGLAESRVLVLEKPFGPSALAEVVERALGGGSSAPPRPNRLKA
jgi:FixJ family two-component response regulator